MNRLILRSAQRARPPLSAQNCDIRARGRTLLVGQDVFRGRLMHTTKALYAIKPFILADIGEGITECQITNWFVKPGDKVEQFDPICEAQSDKATVEITSRFDGTITKLHYEVDDTAIVGKPLVDIDMEGVSEAENVEQAAPNPITEDETNPLILEKVTTPPSEPQKAINIKSENRSRQVLSPAVRHQLKTLGIDPSEIMGTGKDGRILKEDVQNYIDSKTTSPTPAPAPPTTVTPPNQQSGPSGDQIVPLTSIENQMFQTMTKSLSIPQFLYTNSVEIANLNELRKRANDRATEKSGSKLTTLPFILKALSQTLREYPKVNSHLDTTTDPARPKLIVKSAHNFGIAVDTPQGLLVPIVKNVQDHSVISLAAEINRLSELAKSGKLQPHDFKDGTFIVSNIGSIGGNVVSPVIVAPMVGILGVGRGHTVPAFGKDGKVVPREQMTLSWSADHRILDGATVARCAEAMKQAIEMVELMATSLA